MFEKIALAITAFLLSMFIGLYYYERGLDAPEECIELHKDYQTLSQMIKSDDYKEIAEIIFTPEKIHYIHNMENHYDRLLAKQFRRTGYDNFKKICISARESLNINKIIEAFQECKVKARQSIDADDYEFTI